MRGLNELNKEVEKILNDPKNYDKTIRIWRTRAKAGKLSIQKKIEIVEKFGAHEVLIKLVPISVLGGEIFSKMGDKTIRLVTGPGPYEDDGN